MGAIHFFPIPVSKLFLLQLHPLQRMECWPVGLKFWPVTKETRSRNLVSCVAAYAMRSSPSSPCPFCRLAWPAVAEKKQAAVELEHRITRRYLKQLRKRQSGECLAGRDSVFLFLCKDHLLGGAGYSCHYCCNQNHTSLEIQFRVLECGYHSRMSQIPSLLPPAILVPEHIITGLLACELS